MVYTIRPCVRVYGIVLCVSSHSRRVDVDVDDDVTSQAAAANLRLINVTSRRSKFGVDLRTAATDLRTAASNQGVLAIVLLLLEPFELCTVPKTA